MIPFRTDWFDLLAVQESSPASQLKSINSSVVSLLYGQTLHPYMTTGKTIALTMHSFALDLCQQSDVSKLFIMLSRFVIAFLPRSKCFLISWVQSPSTMILEPKKIKSVIATNFPPSICCELMVPDVIILVF